MKIPIDQTIDVPAVSSDTEGLMSPRHLMQLEGGNFPNGIQAGNPRVHDVHLTTAVPPNNRSAVATLKNYSQRDEDNAGKGLGQDLLRVYSAGDVNEAGEDTIPSVRIDPFGKVFFTRCVTLAGTARNSLYQALMSAHPTATGPFMLGILSDENPDSPLMVLRPNSSEAHADQELICGLTWLGHHSFTLTAAGKMWLKESIMVGNRKVLAAEILPEKISSPDATDLASLLILVNELKATVNTFLGAVGGE